MRDASTCRNKPHTIHTHIPGCIHSKLRYLDTTATYPVLFKNKVRRILLALVDVF